MAACSAVRVSLLSALQIGCDAYLNGNLSSCTTVVFEERGRRQINADRTDQIHLSFRILLLPLVYVPWSRAAALGGSRYDG